MTTVALIVFSMRMNATPLLEPSPGGTMSFTIDDLQPRTFVDLLDRHKALILQSASNEPWTTDDFGDILSNLQLEYYPYIGGAAPRTIIPVKAGGDIVFTANERYEHDDFVRTDSRSKRRVRVSLIAFVSATSNCIHSYILI